VEHCALCGGLCERVPFPLMGNLQFPYPVPDPTNATHYLPWCALVSRVAVDERMDAYCFRPSFLVSLVVSGSKFQPGNFRDAESRKSSLVAQLCRDCRVSCASEKTVLMLEIQKQIERYLRKQALTKDALTTCGKCLLRVLIVDVGHCETCARNVCSACFAVHTKGHKVGPPKILSDDINWEDVGRCGLVNGHKVTKAMLYDHLRGTGQWEPRF